MFAIMREDVSIAGIVQTRGALQMQSSKLFVAKNLRIFKNCKGLSIIDVRSHGGICPVRIFRTSGGVFRCGSPQFFGAKNIGFF